MHWFQFRFRIDDKNHCVHIHLFEGIDRDNLLFCGKLILSIKGYETFRYDLLRCEVNDTWYQNKSGMDQFTLLAIADI